MKTVTLERALRAKRLAVKISYAIAMGCFTPARLEQLLRRALRLARYVTRYERHRIELLRAA